MNHFRLRRRATLAALVSALTLAGGAFAQGPGPGGMHGPGFAGMQGPGPGAMHGPGAGAMHGEMLAHLLQQVKAGLNLNTSQQLQWDAALAQSRNAREQGRTLHDKVKATLDAELAKSEPDFAAVATVADGVEAQGRGLRHGVRDQWLGVYATFSPEQKAVVRDALKQRLARFEGMRERMHERRAGKG